GADSGVRNEQLDRSELALRGFDPPSDVVGVRHVTLEREATDLVGDDVYLCASAPCHGDAHAGIGELARDRGADPPPATCDEGNAVETVRRHERSLPVP